MSETNILRAGVTLLFVVLGVAFWRGGEPTKCPSGSEAATIGSTIILGCH